MKKSGFTLIELLAVIVVLAVIALISVPIITSVIDKAKVGALKDSAYGILDASELYLAKNMSEGIDDTIEFTCSNGKCINGEKTISYKGQIDEGKVRIYSDSKIELCITDNKNAALKKVTEKEVIVSKGTCKYNELSYDVNALISQEDLEDLQKEFEEYKNKFNTETTATSEDIFAGKTAYDNQGNLIVGTFRIKQETSFDIGGGLSSTHPYAVTTVASSGNWCTNIDVTEEIETINFELTGSAPTKTYYIVTPVGNLNNPTTIDSKEWEPGSHQVCLNAKGLTSYYVSHYLGDIPYYGANGQNAYLKITLVAYP